MLGYITFKLYDTPLQAQPLFSIEPVDYVTLKSISKLNIRLGLRF